MLLWIMLSSLVMYCILSCRRDELSRFIMSRCGVLCRDVMYHVAELHYCVESCPNVLYFVEMCCVQYGAMAEANAVIRMSTNIISAVCM
jgi:hypothetical protein